MFELAIISGKQHFAGSSRNRKRFAGMYIQLRIYELSGF